MPLWPYPWEACSHKQVINVFRMILAFSVIIYENIYEKWQNLCLIEAILGYLVFPHKQRLKAVQVNFICYFAEGAHSSSGISLFHRGVSQGGGGQVPGLLGDITSSIKSKICL